MFIKYSFQIYESAFNAMYYEIMERSKKIIEELLGIEPTQIRKKDDCKNLICCLSTLP